MPTPTFCRICEAACGLVADTSDDGTLTLRPDKDHPTSRGFVCAKGTRFPDVAAHPERLLAPRLRDARSLRAVSWDAALSDVARRVRAIQRQHGPHAVGLYFGNPLAFNTLGLVGTLAFARWLGTRNVFSAASQDCANKFAGATIVHGSAVIHPIPDVEHAELLVFVGSNPAVSQSSFVHLPGGALALDEAKKRGAELVFVDPRRTESAKRWGGHLPIRPGTDVFFLLSLLHALRDRTEPGGVSTGLAELRALAARYPAERTARATGISVDAVHALAKKIAEKPTVLHGSVGMNHGPLSTLAYVVLQAISFVTGNLDRRGGSLFHPLAVRGAELLARFGAERSPNESRVGGLPAVLHALPGAVLADEILEEGPERLRALFVVAGDPLVSIPGGDKLRRAFEKLDLLVSLDLFENHTGRLAHALLPTTSWLERWDVANTTLPFQTTDLAQIAGPVARAPGETREEWRIFAELAARLGASPLVGLLARVPLPGGPFAGRGVRQPVPAPGTYLGRGPRTDGHQLRFFDPSIARLGDELERTLASAASSGLLLIGRRRRLGHNAWLHDAAHDGDAEAAAWMAPTDLAAHGLREGMRAKITTEEGEVTLPVVGREGVAPGTVVVPHGLRTPGANANALFPSGPAAVERASGQVRMTGIAVEVAPAEIARDDARARTLVG